jgi:hypothetical protein
MKYAQFFNQSLLVDGRCFENVLSNTHILRFPEAISLTSSPVLYSKKQPVPYLRIKKKSSGRINMRLTAYKTVTLYQMAYHDIEISFVLPISSHLH